MSRVKTEKGRERGGRESERERVKESYYSSLIPTVSQSKRERNETKDKQ